MNELCKLSSNDNKFKYYYFHVILFHSLAGALVNGVTILFNVKL